MERLGGERIDRLFVPLNEKWWKKFKSGEKTWELRGKNSRFNEKTIWKGQRVELRRGYKYDPMWGKITAIKKYDHAGQIDEQMAKKLGIESKEDLRWMWEYSNQYIQVGLIAFEVELDRR